MSDERMSDSEALAHPAVITGPLVPLSQYRRLLAERDQLREALERIERGHCQATSSRGVDELRAVARDALSPSEDSTP